MPWKAGLKGFLPQLWSKTGPWTIFGALIGASWVVCGKPIFGSKEKGGFCTICGFEMHICGMIWLETPLP